MIEHLPSLDDKSILPGNELARHDALASWCESPASRPKRLVQDTSVLDFWKIQDSIRLYFDIVLRDGC